MEDKMSQDRFDQFYMLQTRAKDLEKKNKPKEALELYIDIIDNYFPDTDYSFGRAVSLLREEGNNESAKKYCQLAIERLNAKEIKGDYTFFNAILNELENEENATNKVDLSKFLNRKTIIAVLYSIIALMLSFPFKIYKFAFIIFFAVSLLLIWQIIQALRNNLKITMQTIALLLVGSLTIGSAAMIPKPEWTSFFSLKPLAQVGGSKMIDAPSGTIVGDDDNAKKEKLEQGDLDTLEQVSNDPLVVDDYEIWYEGDVIFLTIFAKNNANDEEIKAATNKILKELNAIKGMKTYENRLGDLYKQYDAKVAVYDEDGTPKFVGLTSRHTLKVKWQ